MQDKSLEMSVPQTRTVHGVQIEKVPIGRYLTVMKEMEELPARLFRECFPDTSLDQLMARLSCADKQTLLELSGRIMARAPETLIEVLCGIMGLDSQRMMDTCTPAELLDIFTAFWEANDLSGFFGNVWELLKRRLPTRTIGSKSGSPLPKA